MKVVTLFLGQMSDPGDIIGLPNKDDDDTGLDKHPDRRAWKRVSDMIVGISDLKKLHAKAISGIVGKNAATTFMNSISTRKLLNARDVLLELSKKSQYPEEI